MKLRYARVSLICQLSVFAVSCRCDRCNSAIAAHGAEHALVQAVDGKRIELKASCDEGAKYMTKDFIANAREIEISLAEIAHLSVDYADAKESKHNFEKELGELLDRSRQFNEELHRYLRRYRGDSFVPENPIPPHWPDGSPLEK